MTEETNNIDPLFNRAVKYINDTTNKNIDINDKVRLKFYKYYKQAIVGNCNTPQPSLFDFTNKIKWEAWNSLKDMSQDKAKCLYIKLLQNTDLSFK